ncbi:MAG: DUF2341 domain-containing protein, partial [Methanoregula sp.]|nr:DUF2341 domain-containing protein [Methanoregula sp.]
WDFGDSATSFDQNPVHTYAADGNYTVNLTVTNSYGSNSLVKIGYITVGSGIPIASFTADVTNGYSPVAVQFTDTSTINPTSWVWNFGDGTTSIEQNPVHTYSTYGLYTVSLMVANRYGNTTHTKSDYIYIGKNEYSQMIEFSAGDPTVYEQIVEIHRTFGTAYQQDINGMRIWHLYIGDLCREDYGDVRFTDGAGSQLQYYLQSDYTASEARFYVRLTAADTAGNLKVWYGDLGYGALGLTTTSNVNATAIENSTDRYVFDAFSTLDSDWVTSGVASALISSDKLKTTPNANNLGSYQTAAIKREITPVSGAFSADVDLTYTVGNSNYPYRSRGELYLVLYNSSTSHAAAGLYDSWYGTSTSYNGSFFYNLSGTSASSGQGTRPASGSMHIRITRDTTNTVSVYEDEVLRATGTMPGAITSIGLSNTQYSSNSYYYNALWDNLVIRADTVTLPSVTSWNGMAQTAGSPVASFTGTPVYGPTHTIRFTDTSANYPTTWSWDFGDGTTSTLQNPVHTFAADGNYTVTLAATNEYGSTSITINDFAVETRVVTSVTISPLSVQLNVSETRQFTAVLIDQKGNVMTNTSITWSSSDDTVGTINANGLFTGLAAGKTNVAASAGGVYSSAAEVSVIGLAPDLKVTSVSSTGYPTTTSVNATIQNAGTADAGAFQTLLSVSGNSTTFNVTGLAVGNTITLSLTDVTRHKAGDIIPLNITVDVGNTIPELNEINNEFNTTVTTGAYGDSWMGNRYYNGVDLETVYYAEGHVGVAISNGNTGYGGGNPTYTSSNLPIPSNATIKVAHLCLAWTWYGYAPYQNVTFNGHEISTPIAHHADNADGQDIYDVTAYFNPNATNTATIINGPSANYGRTLVVIYEDSSQPYRQIWLDEGYDILYHDPATGYAVFNNVTHGDVASAQLINVLPSGDTTGDGQNILFNGQSNTMVVKKGSDPAFGYYSVTSALQNGTNDMGVSATGSYMSLSTSILTITHVTASEAGFTATPTSGKTPLTVLFTDTSTGTPATWNWDFGDGSTSTEQNPTHTYRTVGNYTVNLTVMNSLGSDTESKARYIIARAPSANDALIPIVGFTADTTSGTFPLTVQFNDTTTGNVTNWIWDFQNDGTTDSTLQNPAFTYTSAGSYAVNLTVSGPDGSNSTLKSAFITVNLVTGTSLPLTNEKNGTVSGDLYVASFQPVPFVNQPTTGVTSRDFDQPFTIPAFTNIQWARVYVNVYSGSGSADWPTWTTTTLDADGDGTYETVLGVENMTTSTYSADGKVYWINDHTNRVYSDYETSYDVTNLITSSHPAVHVKNQKIGTGSYDGRLKAVTLVVAYNDGDSDTVKYWVNHGHDWFNAGSSSTMFGTAGIPTGFTDATLSNVALSSIDGTYTFNSVSQAGANPVAPINYYENHTWSVTGAINPATDTVFQYALGTGSSFKTTLAALAVRYPGSAPVLIADFTSTPTSGTAPLTVNFTDTSTGSPTVWNWSFGDGTTSSLQNPVHTYVTTGNYTVNLTATNSVGSSSKVQAEYIKVGGALAAPVAGFTADVTNGTAPLTVNFTDQSTGTPTSWLWDFGDNDTSSVQNPSHTYTAAGTYTVNLTVTGAGGSTSAVKTSLITVTSPGADLIVSAGPVSSSSPSPNLLAHYTANTIKATVRNQGTQSAGSFNVTFNVNGNLTPVNVAGLGAGSSTVVNTTDTVDRSVGAFVPVIVIADAEVAVAESNKTNNQYFYNATVIRNGYAGMRWGDGPDITTTKVTTLHGDIVYSLGNSAYGSGSAAWTAGDLPIPAGATVKDARLYITYCWDSGNVMPGAAVTSFNGVAKSYESFYSDKKNWGGYAYPFGVIIYNVTDQFNTSGNSVSATGIPPIRGMELVVTYEDPTATEKQIFVNEGFDLLYASPSYYTTEETATAYAPFTGASIALGNVNQATLTTFINRGGSGITRGTMFFNGEEYPNYWTIAGPEIGVNTTDVTANLKETGNTVAFRSLVANNMDMEPHLAILKVERKGGSTATLSATSVSGIGKNQNGTIGIYLNNSFSPKAGSLTVQLYYNESILSAQAVEIMADGVAPTHLSSPITLAIATAAGIPNGNAWLGNVTFSSRQDTEVTSALGLALITLT